MILQTRLEMHEVPVLMRAAKVALQFEFKESFRLRIHSGKKITVLLWSVISFSETRIEERFYARRTDHGSTMKLLYEVSS